jgi:hypothetical protein
VHSVARGPRVDDEGTVQAQVGERYVQGACHHGCVSELELDAVARPRCEPGRSAGSHRGLVPDARQRLIQRRSVPAAASAFRSRRVRRR